MIHPPSKKQLQFLRTPLVPTNFLVGVTAAGKTHVALMRLIIELNNAPKKGTIRFLITAQTHSNIQRSLISELLPMLDNYGIPLKKIEVSKGSVGYQFENKILIPQHANNIDAVRTIRGGGFYFWLGDEVTKYHPSFFREALIRLRYTDENQVYHLGKCLLTLNPDRPSHFIKTDYIDQAHRDPSIRVWNFGFDDNPTMPEDVKKSYLTDKKFTGAERDRLILGKWVVDAEGAVYPEFIRTKHCFVGDPPAPDMIILGMDFGYKNPTAILKIAYANEIFWVTQEYYANTMIDNAFCFWLFEESDFFDSTETYLRVYCDTAGQEAIDRLNLYQQENYGKIILPFVDSNKSVQPGVSTLKSLFASGRIRISEKCHNLLREIDSYEWMPGDNEIPRKRDDHAMDALRYAIYTHMEAGHT